MLKLQFTSYVVVEKMLDTIAQNWAKNYTKFRFCDFNVLLEHTRGSVTELKHITMCTPYC